MSVLLLNAPTSNNGSPCKCMCCSSPMLTKESMQMYVLLLPSHTSHLFTPCTPPLACYTIPPYHLLHVSPYHPNQQTTRLHQLPQWLVVCVTTCLLRSPAQLPTTTSKVFAATALPGGDHSHWDLATWFHPTHLAYPLVVSPLKLLNAPLHQHSAG